MVELFVIVDTLSFRANFESYAELVDFLGIEGVDFLSSDKRFNMNYMYSLFYEGIKIGCDGQAGWNYYIHMSGKGCRTFEDIQGEGFSWEKFLFKLSLKVRNNLAAITRIDLACDEYSNTLNLARAEKYLIQKKYLTRCPDSSIRLVKFGEECLYVGSTQSKTLMRIYNKKLERGYDKEDNEEIEFWHRCELQLRDEHSQQVVLEIGEGQNIGKVFAGHTRYHFNFLTKPNKRDGCQSRIPIAGWWNDFLCNASEIAWSKAPGTEYNMHRLQKYAIGNAGSSIKTMIEAQNLDAEQLYAIYTEPGIKLREDQKAFIRAHGGKI